MKVIKTIAEMQMVADKYRAEGKTIGFVPTMGYLHEGHGILMQHSSQKCDITVTSIFVNPTQFAPNEDFEKYPRDFERDEKVASLYGTDIIFYPDVLEIYPKAYSTSIIVDNVTKYFEGEKRPHHFSGVATVVGKLFNIVKPHFAFFGQKDYQQTLVVKRMTTDLNFDLEIVVVPTVRESNGLAMSSRNSYLSIEEKSNASIIFKAIENARNVIERGETSRKIINAVLHKTLRSIPELRIDYAEVVDADTLEAYEQFLPGEKVVILIACYMGRTRLIDNSLLTIPNRLNQENFIKEK